MGKVTMADVAKKVGVSTVSVHNALCGQKGISDEMRQRILQTAEEMGYQPRKNMVHKDWDRTKNIGVLVAEKYLKEYRSFYCVMYKEMAIAATDKNCMTAVEILEGQEKGTYQLPKLAMGNRVEGLIILGEVNRDYIRFLKRHVKIPIVFLDFYDKDLAKDAVISDSFYGMYLMTEYLIENGHEKLAFVGSIHATSSILDRYCGFSRSLLEHRLELPEEWVIEDRDEEGSVEFALPEHLPQAFVCNCDLAAGLVIEKLEERGLRVPEDISVVGFDNYLYPGMADKKITSYQVNMKAMVRTALDKILKQIGSKNSGRGLEIVTGKIVEKESVRKREYDLL